ncbi:MAG: hypothetical protein ACO3QN_02180 [Bacilli bacterium]
MKNISFILWLVLVIYTIIYSLFFGREGTLLPLMIQGTADPFAQNFFNLMGLVPGYFLLDFLLNIQKNKFNFLPFIFGFFGGAYAILLGYMKHQPKVKPLKRWHKMLLVILMMSTLTVMILGFLNGQPQVYLEAFFTDPMVGIMLIDFFVLYTWSIIRAYQRYHYWYVSFIPMVGFGMLMLGSDRRQ